MIANIIYLLLLLFCNHIFLLIFNEKFYIILYFMSNFKSAN